MSTNNTTDLSCSSDSERSVSHAHAIQPFARNISHGAITIHNETIPAKLLITEFFEQNANHTPHNHARRAVT